MFRSVLARSFLLFASCATLTGLAHAQGGRCSDNRINLAFNASLHRAPNGAGTSGECDASRYGGGSWANQNDLIQRTGYSTWCPNPFVGQIYWNLYHRGPRPQECDVNQYGPGAANANYMSLTNMIQHPQISAPPSAGPQVTANDLVVCGDGALCTSTGAVRFVKGAWLITQDGAGLITDNGGGLVASGGGNLVASGGGNLVASGGGNLAPGTVLAGAAAGLNSYHVAGADGRRTTPIRIVRR